jgi:hypothetical protein
LRWCMNDSRFACLVNRGIANRADEPRIKQ